MACPCVKGSFKYSVEVIDNKNIIYTDLSDWMSDEFHQVPDEYYVTVSFPGGLYKRKIKVKTGFSTRLEASALGVSCFVDGPYCFTLDREDGGCGKDYHKFYALLPNLKCCLKKAFATTKDQNKIDEIKDLIDSIENDTELQNIQQASNSILTAKTKLEKFKCDCGC